MRVWLYWLGSVSWILLGIACTETEITPFPPPPEPTSQDMGSQDQGINQNPEEPISVIGLSCEGETERCGATGVCIDGNYLATLGLDPEVLTAPNGMCSKFCSEDRDCGEGARCFNTQPFSGIPIKACLATCEIMVDCRWREGYSCLDPRTVDAEDDGDAVCMPDAFIYEVYCAADSSLCEAPLEEGTGEDDE